MQVKDMRKPSLCKVLGIWGKCLEGWKRVTQLEQREGYDAEKSLEELRAWSLHWSGVKRGLYLFCKAFEGMPALIPNLCF